MVAYKKNQIGVPQWSVWHKQENVVFLTLLCKMHCMAVFALGTRIVKCVRQTFVWLKIAGNFW